MEAPLTFKDYLAGRKAGADAAGDFVRLARRDSGFPDVVSLDELLAYLESRRNYDALAGAQFVWRKYVTARRDADRKRTQTTQTTG